MNDDIAVSLRPVNRSRNSAAPRHSSSKLDSALGLLEFCTIKSKNSKKI